MTAPPRPARSPAPSLVWLGVAPFALFALLFLILPTLKIVFAAFRTPDGSFTLSNIAGLATPTFAIVIGEYVLAALLNRPAFGPYMVWMGSNRAYEPAALAVIAFAITWGCLGLIQLVARLAPHTRARS